MMETYFKTGTLPLQSTMSQGSSDFECKNPDDLRNIDIDKYANDDSCFDKIDATLHYRELRKFKDITPAPDSASDPAPNLVSDQAPDPDPDPAT